MIRIVTGTPGAGKTAYVVDEIVFGDFKDRKVYHNINGLDRDNAEQWDKDQFQAWYVDYKDKYGTDKEQELERNVLFVIDEVQFVFPNRPASSTPPDYIKMLDVHRHFGLDFILITQDLRKCDPVLRGDTVEEHVHIWDSGLLTPFGWRNKSVFQGVRLNPNASIKTAKQTTFYKPKKRVFKHYRSALAHTKVKRQVHSVFYALLFCLLGGAYYAWQYSTKGMLSTAKGIDSSQEAQSMPVQGVSYGADANAATAFNEMDFQPVHPSYPESAPLYDGNRPLKPMRRIAGCIKSAKGCNCYDDEAVPLVVPFQTCVDFVNHEYYTPYAPQASARVALADTAEQPVTAAPSPAPQPTAQPQAAADTAPQIVADSAPKPPKIVAVPVQKHSSR